MAPARSMVTVRPLFDSSGRDCAFGSEMSTPPCIIGAVIMKMIISSIITSIRLTTLISALSGSRSRPRPRRAIRRNPVVQTMRELQSSDHPLSYHQCDQLRGNAFQLAFDLVETRSKNVVCEHRRNRHAERCRRRNQSLGHAWRHRAHVAGALGGNADEGIYYHEDGTKEPDQGTD